MKTKTEINKLKKAIEYCMDKNPKNNEKMALNYFLQNINELNFIFVNDYFYITINNLEFTIYKSISYGKTRYSFNIINKYSDGYTDWNEVKLREEKIMRIFKISKILGN